MITFEQIQEANKGLESLDFKGKDYVMVPQRVKAFRKLFPEGFIKTEILSIDNGVVVMQSRAGYYSDNGQEITLGTGLAYEKESSSYINKTSYIENCETSAVGRALGFLALGIDGGGICSAEELANAVNNQNRNNNQKQPEPEKLPEMPKERVAPKAQTTTGNKVPSLSPEMAYLSRELSEVANAQNTNMESIKATFEVCRKVGIKEKVIPDKKVTEYTMEEVKTAIEYMKAKMVQL